MRKKKALEKVFKGHYLKICVKFKSGFVTPIFYFYQNTDYETRRFVDR